MNFMIAHILPLMFCAPDGYLAAYRNESASAVEFFDTNRPFFEKHFPNATDEELALYYSIVAPEVSQYNELLDFFEVAALQRKYVADGSCDYSVGRFQMKPGFAESMENEVRKNPALRARYGAMFAYKAQHAKGKRAERVGRLCSVEWQVRYLAVFVEVAARRTAGWGLKGNVEKLRCWATLYNAGTYLSKARVEQRQGVRQFPRGTKEHNYSAVSVGFYEELLMKRPDK
jgi:hypothetical protein